MHRTNLIDRGLTQGKKESNMRPKRSEAARRQQKLKGFLLTLGQAG